MSEIFVGMNVVDSYQFRLTRNSDIFLDEEETEDPLESMAIGDPMSMDEPLPNESDPGMMYGLVQ